MNQTQEKRKENINMYKYTQLQILCAKEDEHSMTAQYFQSRPLFHFFFSKRKICDISNFAKGNSGNVSKRGINETEMKKERRMFKKKN